MAAGIIDIHLSLATLYLQTDSIEAPDNSLRLLTPLVDFVARINNDRDDAPVLEALETVDRSGCWNHLGTKFQQDLSSPVASEFPYVFLLNSLMGTSYPTAGNGRD